MLFNLELDTENSYRALGRLIKFYRMRSGYTLRDLGTLTNVSHTLVANIEQGKVKGSDETLKDLFRTLHLEFTDATDIFLEFKQSYDIIFDCLFKYEYTRATTEMSKLLEKEQIYMHSVLITDYGLIKFLHNVLLGKQPKDQYIDITVFRSVANNFSERQRQIYLLIEGVNCYNKGEYSNAIEYLKDALKVGNSNLDYLVKVFLVKCYVKTYHFMQVIKLGNEAIEYFEEKIYYLRAMEVRLSIAYSFMLNRNLEDAKELLDSVYEFSNNFNAIYLIEEAKLLLGSYHLFRNETEIAKEYLYTVNLDNALVSFLKFRIAIRNKDVEEMKKIYTNFTEQDNEKIMHKDKLLFDITAREVGIIEMDDSEFIKIVEEAIKNGEQAHDIEVIDSCYNFLIRHYQKNRSYKKALESALKARDIRRYGCLNYK